MRIRKILILENDLGFEKVTALPASPDPTGVEATVNPASSGPAREATVLPIFSSPAVVEDTASTQSPPHPPRRPRYRLSPPSVASTPARRASTPEVGYVVPAAMKRFLLRTVTLLILLLSSLLQLRWAETRRRSGM
jgi:hypothetical protein